MQVHTDWQSFPPDLRGGVLCVGNFDGVHVGHAAMLATGRAQATARHRPFTIMTFDPHPSTLLKPDTPRPPLTTVAQKHELLAEFSPDVLLVIPTTRVFLSLSAEDFLRQVVRGQGTSGVGATLLIEGRSFTYGRGAKGTIDTLQSEGPALGLEAIIVPTQEQSLSDMTIINVSSTAIRWLASQGRVADAARALGRPYTLRGTVVHGQHRGRTIGVPTANLQTPQLIPAPGVYAGRVVVDGKPYAAAISVGVNATFQSTATTVEAYLLDFSGDLYGRTLDVAFHAWLRDMYIFGGVTPLVTQMQRDIAWTRRAMAH
jgi:riboflavin kinase / FMN adenylyltransferase